MNTFLEIISALFCFIIWITMVTAIYFIMTYFILVIWILAKQSIIHIGR